MVEEDIQKNYKEDIDKSASSQLINFNDFGEVKFQSNKNATESYFEKIKPQIVRMFDNMYFTEKASSLSAMEHCVSCLIKTSVKVCR